MGYYKGDRSQEDRSANSTGNILGCHTPGALAEVLLLWFEKWKLKV